MMLNNKYYFLLYFPILYLTPPLHETVHVLLAWLFGVKVTAVEFALTTFQSKGSNMHWFLQDFWDNSIMLALCLGCILFFIYYCLKAHHVKIRRIQDDISHEMD